MISAILLAAGQSKRFKNENKLTKIYKNKPLINYAVNSLINSKVNKIIIVLGYQSKKVKKIIMKSKKINFIINKNFKTGISTSIKSGLKKLNKNSKGFIIVQSDMPFVGKNTINKIYLSILKKKHQVHVLKFKNKIGNPIGFDISLKDKFNKIKGDLGAKFLVKRLKKNTNFIKISSVKTFKDFDKEKDFI